MIWGMMVLAGCASNKNQPVLPFETVEIPGGTFWVGDVFEETDTDATPIHRTVVAPFLMGRFEITFDQYDAYATETGTPLPADNEEGRGNRAVVNITWEEARDFCTHYGFRLPTEVEWEYAARSAGQKHLYAGVDSTNQLYTIAWYGDNGPPQSMPIGAKTPNTLGLYDMSGNVFEWIGDYYEFYPAPDSVPTYKDLNISSMRIIRGGSYKTHAAMARTYRRAGTLADFPADDIGFRCARSILTDG